MTSTVGGAWRATLESAACRALQEPSCDSGPSTLTPDQLRALVEANAAIIGELALPGMLRPVVEAACRLIDAPYGALGVASPDGSGLAEFVAVGFNDDVLTEFGNMPLVQGVFGEVMESSRPWRLANISACMEAEVMAQRHPDVRALMGVPVRVRDESYGILFVARTDASTFTADDEELLLALSEAAGVAIHNAWLYEMSRRRQEWLQASTEVTRRLLASVDEEHLRVIADSVCHLAAADLVVVTLPDDTGTQLVMAAVVGRDAEMLPEPVYPLAGSMSERVLRSGLPALIDDPADVLGGEKLSIAESIGMGPAMVLPLSGTEQPRGTLVVCRRTGSERFTQEDLEMTSTFAYHTAIALELADARRDQQRILLLEERARIARDLHDHVIQQLFAAGMMLQRVVGIEAASDGTSGLEPIVSSLDQAVNEIRTSIHQLQPPPRRAGGLRAAVLGVIAEARLGLGVRPQVRLHGPLESVADDSMVSDVTAVLREALTNVAKHADAESVNVRVNVCPAGVAVTIEDDGAGIATARRSGLNNLRERAERRGGTFGVNDPPPDTGTVVRWTVPR